MDGFIDVKVGDVKTVPLLELVRPVFWGSVTDGRTVPPNTLLAVACCSGVREVELDELDFGVKVPLRFISLKMDEKNAML